MCYSNRKRNIPEYNIYELFEAQIRKYRCIENDLLTGMVFGKRSRGRQKTRLTNTINERLGLTMNEAITTAQDRDKWRIIVYDTTAFGKPNVLIDSIVYTS